MNGDGIRSTISSLNGEGNDLKVIVHDRLILTLI